MQFVDVTTDRAFKKVFGSEQHKDILIGFLNAVLDVIMHATGLGREEIEGLTT